MTLDLITCGEAMGVIENERIGPFRMGGPMRLSIAGAESTVAIGVVRLGGSARWIGVVGDDEIGQLVRRTLNAEGVETQDVLTDPHRPTSLMLKERRTASSSRVRYYRRHGAGAGLSPEHISAEEVGRAQVLHLTGITPALSASARAATWHALDLAGAAGTRICIDLNYRSALWDPAEASPVLTDLVRRADVVLATLEEAQLVTGANAGDPARSAASLGRLGPALVVIKLGPDGAVAWDDGVEQIVPAHPATVLDPVGAGDAFAAGLLADLARGCPAREAIETAAAVASVNVACPGDWEGLPTRAEIHQLRSVDVLR